MAGPLPSNIVPDDYGHVAAHNSLHSLDQFLQNQSAFNVTGFAQGIASARPAPNVAGPGKLYYAIDTALLSYTDGTSWADVTGVAGPPGPAGAAGGAGPPGPAGSSTSSAYQFDVKAPAYGAVGDGVADDTAAINAAIAAAAAAGGGVVFLPAVSAFYKITTLNLLGNVHLLGEGFGSELRQTPGTAAPFMRNPTPGTVQRSGSVRNLFINANTNSANAGGILLSGCTYFVISDNVIAGWRDFGVRLLGGPNPGETQDNRIVFNLIENPLSNPAVAIDLVSSAACMPDGTVASFNMLNGAVPPTGTTAIKVRGHATLLYIGPSGCSFIGNSIQSYETLFDTESVDSFFVNNRCEAFANCFINVLANAKSNIIGPNEYGVTGGVLAISDVAANATQYVGDMDAAGSYLRRSKLSNLTIDRHLAATGLPSTFDTPAIGATITVDGNSIRGVITISTSTPIPSTSAICRVLFGEPFTAPPKCVMVWGQENHPLASDFLSSNITTNGFTLTSASAVDGAVVCGYMVIA